MSNTYDVKTKINGCWLNILTKDVEPRIEGITFSTYNRKALNQFENHTSSCILIKIDNDVFGSKNEFVSLLKGVNIKDEGVLEEALKNFVCQELGYILI